MTFSPPGAKPRGEKEVFNTHHALTSVSAFFCYYKFMNALWIKNLCEYKNTTNAVFTAKTIIDLKIKRREIILKKYKLNRKFSKSKKLESIQDVLLYEARNAKNFWREFSYLLPSWCVFKTRVPHSETDITNKLLDVGYHHLANEVKKNFIKYNIPTELGIIHVAGNSSDTPLVYDLMEIFRGDIVDTEVVRFLRLKKKPILKIKQKDISHFIYEINQRMNKKYFLKEFRRCQTYRYYMELQILKFVKAVNHKSVFSPIYLPSRHDNRCSKKP